MSSNLSAFLGGCFVSGLLTSVAIGLGWVCWQQSYIRREMTSLQVTLKQIKVAMQESALKKLQQANTNTYPVYHPQPQQSMQTVQKQQGQPQQLQSTNSARSLTQDKDKFGGEKNQTPKETPPYRHPIQNPSE